MITCRLSQISYFIELILVSITLERKFYNRAKVDRARKGFLNPILSTPNPRDIVRSTPPRSIPRYFHLRIFPFNVDDRKDKKCGISNPIRPQW